MDGWTDRQTGRVDGLMCPKDTGNGFAECSSFSAEALTRTFGGGFPFLVAEQRQSQCQCQSRSPGEVVASAP